MGISKGRIARRAVGEPLQAGAVHRLDPALEVGYDDAVVVAVGHVEHPGRVDGHLAGEREHRLG